MKRWAKILSASIILAAVLLLLIITFFLCRRRRRSRRPRVSTSIPKPFTDPSAASRAEKLEAGISKFHLSPIKSDSKNSLRFHQLPHLHIPDHHHLQTFNWDDHPRLITEAVENGWFRFAFHGRPSSSLPPLRSPQIRWGLCVVCDGDKQHRNSSEINWEIPPGSSEFMQTVKINSARDDELASSSSCSIVKMSLPLPGPSLATASFPQEAYFEISILHLGGISQPRFHRTSKRSKGTGGGGGGGGGSIEGDRMKLIQENSSEGDLESGRKNGVLELNSVGSVLSLGLSIGSLSSEWSMMKPGSYSGSIGFHSDGSVYLDGIKLMFESEAAQWNGVNKVIGLGYNPSKQMVFLTIDSELVRVIHCNSDIYKHPLYPVISANTEVMVLINLGQSAFKYAPANARRTTNPCFIRSSPDVTVSTIAGNYEDSRELFSVGRLESDWYDIMMKSKNKGSTKTSVGNGDESIADADSDLFEISLQS
ncbi:uncharacterized protein LOC120266436 [Dioscorea cayenensis subsp. rotundata]|uniref:Uncharacterized protein LOC120266436 n=1 Tax=Dioscorea cayennensis subsp. rotundata TaxID=55577 RepID=A0AB40BRF1_DIOCR|nr:uncharacterized protein LOC120266436 [Dioscorea cayenensis subsp. rotundata]